MVLDKILISFTFQTCLACHYKHKIDCLTQRLNKWIFILWFFYEQELLKQYCFEILMVFMNNVFPSGHSVADYVRKCGGDHLGLLSSSSALWYCQEAWMRPRFMIRRTKAREPSHSFTSKESQGEFKSDYLFWWCIFYSFGYAFFHAVGLYSTWTVADHYRTL